MLIVSLLTILKNSYTIKKEGKAQDPLCSLPPLKLLLIFLSERNARLEKSKLDKMEAEIQQAEDTMREEREKELRLQRMHDVRGSNGVSLS